MKDMLYLIVEYIARIHDKINTLNDHTKGFTDKELHFIVIGVIGMTMVFVLVPLVRWLAERGHYLFSHLVLRRDSSHRPDLCH